jgi:acetate kinase
MSQAILVLNAGSSSIKFEVFDVAPDDGLERRMEGELDGIGTRPRFRAKDAAGKALADLRPDSGDAANVEQAQQVLGRWLIDNMGVALMGVGHRVVHGGADLVRPVLVDDEVILRLARLVPLAPLHQPNNLAPIRTIRARRPDIPQVACFDTAFHRGHPALADHFAIPDALWDEGVRRYGFHGLSYEYIASRLPDIAPEIAKGRVVVAHLGSGASLCALVDGKSVDSTMGFTALDGLPMGTRPGQLDAGVVLYLMDEKGMDARAIERFLYHECGLKGLSGISNDVRDLLASDDPKAAFALDFFALRIAQLTAALGSAMGGLDGLVFTAGVGENAVPVRAAVAARLAWLGLDLDPEANSRHGPLISTGTSRVHAYVIGTDEELMIARHTLAVLRGRAKGPDA